MFCNNCEKEIPDTAEFCRHCGHKIKPLAKPTPAPSKEPTTKKSFPAWAWGLIGIIVVGAIFGGLYFGGFFSTGDRIDAGPEDEPQPAAAEDEGEPEFPEMVHQYLNDPSLVEYTDFDYIIDAWQEWKAAPVITNGIAMIEGTGEWRARAIDHEEKVRGYR